MTGYITAFRRVASKADDATEAEFINHFIRGLWPNIQAQVLLAQPNTFKAACIAAESVGQVFSNPAFSGLGKYEPHFDGAYAGKGRGMVPMEGVNQFMGRTG